MDDQSPLRPLNLLTKTRVQLQFLSRNVYLLHGHPKAPKVIRGDYFKGFQTLFLWLKQLPILISITR
jgi:hypothetical protein